MVSASAAGAVEASPFPSFFMAGFECSMPTLPDGRRLDQIVASQHDTQLAGDYALLRGAGLLTVREAVRWPLVDRGGRLSFETVTPVIRALNEANLTPIWDLFHYGFPSDLDLFSAEFPQRFAAYCGAVAALVKDEMPGPHFYSPINEISYFAYAAGQVGYFAPFGKARGPELKRQLVRADLAAVAAIRGSDTAARFVQVDPLIHLVPPADEPGLAPKVDEFNTDDVYESWLLLAGRKEPDLGGSDTTLDIVGVNLYPLCQWEYQRPGHFLQRDDPRWLPLRELLQQAWARLHQPLLIAETGANGPKRPGWLEYLTAEVQAARAAGLPVLGLCWYPAVSCPDWHDPTSIFPAGLWDAVPEGHRLRRVAYAPVLEALSVAERAMQRAAAVPSRPPLHPPPPAAAPSSRSPGVDQLRVADACACPAMPENYSQQALVAGERMAARAYRLLPGQRVSTRAYPGVETALCVLEGTTTVIDWESSVTLHGGELIVIPPGMPFGLKNQEESSCLLLQISTPRPWSADFQGPEPVDEGSGVRGQGPVRTEAQPALIPDRSPLTPDL